MWLTKNDQSKVGFINSEDSFINSNDFTAYTAPEIVSRERISFATDYYSFGLILYEIITRKLVFSKDLVKALHMSILTKEI